MSECLTVGTDWAPQRWVSGLTQVQTPQLEQSIPEQPNSSLVQMASPLVGTARREREFRDCLERVLQYQGLPNDWDRYGGVASFHRPLEFAEKLLQKLACIPSDVSAPIVRPISGGVYIEWRVGDAVMYFEADDESVLQYSKTALGEQTTEDPEFDWQQAYEMVTSFYDDAA